MPVLRLLGYYGRGRTLPYVIYHKFTPGTSGDFMFLYRFLCDRRRMQTFVHVITSEQLFRISFIFGRIGAPDL